MVLVSMKPFQAEGNDNSRSVCPVGAVSNRTWSKSAVVPGSPKSRENSSKAAISTVQEPESCSSMLMMAASGSTPRYGPTRRSRYSRAAASGSTFKAHRPGTSGTGVGLPPSETPSTSSRFDAGSVLTSSTRFPRSANSTAVAQASEVFPTPPLPVKNRFRVAFSMNCMRVSLCPNLPSILWCRSFQHRAADCPQEHRQQVVWAAGGAVSPTHSASCMRVG